MQDREKRRLEEMLDTEMKKLRKLVEGYVEGSSGIAEMEKGLLTGVLGLCLVLLKFIISVKGAEDLSDQLVCGEEETIKRSGCRRRRYLSLFGHLEFERQSYHSNHRGMLYPLDEVLSMPADLPSYNIQELMGQGACEMSFRESVSVLTTLLGLNLRGVDSERNAERLGGRVESFYEHQVVEIPGEDQCFCASFDGKGVPKVKKSEKASEPPSSRLNKGEKRGVKQMATVVVTSTFKPKVRDKTLIINSLMNFSAPRPSTEEDSPKNDNRWHDNIHRRAFLSDQDKAIKYGLQRISKQITSDSQRVVIPIDAGIGLEDKVLKYVKEYGLETHFDGIILDFVHVSEYVWSCANTILGEKSKIRTAWVTEMLEDLLDSKTQKVIDDLQAIVDKTALSNSKKETINKAITYFTNHAHKMDYETYLKKGYPVTSALVESNCKHLIKDRMEGSGMRWSNQGAQHMMDLRAVKLNGDLNSLMEFVIQSNKKNPTGVAA